MRCRGSAGLRAMRIGVFVKMRHDFCCFVRRMAAHAVRRCDRSMQVHDNVRTITSFFVQRVKILRRKQAQQTGVLERHERLVSRTWTRIPYGRLFLPTPGIFTRFGIAEKLIDVVYIHLLGMLCPNTVGSTKIGDTRSGRNSRPRQNHNVICVRFIFHTDHFSYFFTRAGDTCVRLLLLCSLFIVRGFSTYAYRICISVYATWNIPKPYYLTYDVNEEDDELYDYPTHVTAEEREPIKKHGW